MTDTCQEVYQQPAVWPEAAAILASRSTQIGEFLEPVLAQPDLRIVLTGAGTSAFAGQILAPALTRRLRRRVEAIATTDIVSNPQEMFAENVPTLLVSFARSGDSPESVAAADLALLELTVVYLSNDPYTRQYDQDIAAELRAAIGAGNVLVVDARSSDHAGALQIEGVHDVDDALLSLPYVVIAQLLGIGFSEALGRTPDNPFPDGEVNRVVQGVTIHPLRS
jgi:tagatose-6-phosphate ketose/aldose isomerase